MKWRLRRDWRPNVVSQSRTDINPRCRLQIRRGSIMNLRTPSTDERTKLTPKKGNPSKTCFEDHFVPTSHILREIYSHFKHK